MRRKTNKFIICRTNELEYFILQQVEVTSYIFFKTYEYKYLRFIDVVNGWALFPTETKAKLYIHGYMECNMQDLPSNFAMSTDYIYGE